MIIADALVAHKPWQRNTVEMKCNGFKVATISNTGALCTVVNAHKPNGFLIKGGKPLCSIERIFDCLPLSTLHYMIVGLSIGTISNVAQ